MLEDKKITQIKIATLTVALNRRADALQASDSVEFVHVELKNGKMVETIPRVAKTDLTS